MRWTPEAVTQLTALHARYLAGELRNHQAIADALGRPIEAVRSKIMALRVKRLLPDVSAQSLLGWHRLKDKPVPSDEGPRDPFADAMRTALATGRERMPTEF